MQRLYLKYLVDIGLATSFLICFVTGVIKFPGFLRFIGATHRVIPMKEITLLHDWSGVVLGLLVLAHLALNFGWIVRTTKRIISGAQPSEPDS